MNSPTETRPMAFAKVVLFWAGFFLFLTALRFAPLAPLGAVGFGLLLVGLTVLLTAVFLKVDRRRFRGVGLGVSVQWMPQFIIGLVLGIGVVVCMMGLMTSLTAVYVGEPDLSRVVYVLAATFVVLLVLALMEELAFRTYAFFRLKEFFGVRTAVYLSSIVFAFYHGLAPENLLGPGVWGLFFGIMAIQTKSVALPTGFHLGLNWPQALIGLKPEYGPSIWELSLDAKPGLLAPETLGLIMQLALLAIGVVLTERLARAQSRVHA